MTISAQFARVLDAYEDRGETGSLSVEEVPQDPAIDFGADLSSPEAEAEGELTQAGAEGLDGDGGDSDPALAALEELARSLEHVVSDIRVLSERIKHARAARVGGATWRQVLDNDDDPKLVQLLSQALGQLSSSSGTFRRAMVVSLRQEGASIPSIASLFGVTHQRVSNLLRRTER